MKAAKRTGSKIKRGRQMDKMLKNNTFSAKFVCKAGEEILKH